MKPELATYRFEFAYGKSPKGTGNWLFEDDNFNIIFSAYGTFGQAKKEALAEAKRKGIAKIHVCS